jgi:hypothetical protein
VLVLGTVDAEDGFGPSPFSLAVTPLDLPEPSTSVTFVVGIVILIVYACRITRNRPNPGKAMP